MMVPFFLNVSFFPCVLDQVPASDADVRCVAACPMPGQLSEKSIANRSTQRIKDMMTSRVRTANTVEVRAAFVNG